LLLAQAGPLRAQFLLKEAGRQAERLAYRQAIDLYEQALLNNRLPAPERLTALYQLGYCYRQVRDMPNAERVYRQFFTESGEEVKGERADAYLHYAQALASNGRYPEAQEVYEAYARQRRQDPRGKKFAQLYEDVSLLTRNADSYRVEYLNFNSSAMDFSPTYYRNGLVFVSARAQTSGLRRVFGWNNTPFLDLYHMPDLAATGEAPASISGAGPKAENPVRWMPPVGRDTYTPRTANDSRTLGFLTSPGEPAETPARSASAIDPFSSDLNSPYHEGPLTFTRDGKKVIFTRNNYNRSRYGRSTDGVNKLKLYEADEVEGRWTNIRELPFTGNNYSTGHPALNPDENRLFFASDQPGGYGGVDLYVVRWNREKGEWGRPINLGPKINTKGNELFPFVDERGNLYFSSDGHPGLGELDLFCAQLTKEIQVQSLHNLGAPLNSSKDDFGIITDGLRRFGYFSSNRKRGGADDDISRFQREGSLYACRQLMLQLYDAETKAPLARARVAMETKGDSSQTRIALTDSLGQIRLCLDPEAEFKFSASLDGYQANRLGFSTRDLADDLPIRLDVPLQRLAGRVYGQVLAQQNRQPLDSVRVILRNDCDSTVQELLTLRDGRYAFSTQPGCIYTLEARHKGHVGWSQRISGQGDVQLELLLFGKNDIIRLDNIYYEFREWNIQPEAAVELDKLVALMKQHPGMRIELRSHTDSRASAGFNKRLSARRAQAVSTYLSERGITEDRLVAVGYGETQLANGCRDGVDCSEDEHRQNRRTEFRILAIQ